jgi:hypothetical protein
VFALLAMFVLLIGIRISAAPQPTVSPGCLPGSTRRIAGGVGAVHLVDWRTAEMRSCRLLKSELRECVVLVPFPDLEACSGDLRKTFVTDALVTSWVPDFCAIK